MSAMRRPAVPERLHLALVLAVCAAIYWPVLGQAGFAASEGHRVIPGWTMLESGNWWRLEMFGAPYLRKPPGMAWAVAAYSAVFGETEFAARAVSATAATVMAVLALVFARRWFGRPWGLAAGLACAMTPWYWVSGRSAEIEALNLLATQAAVFLMIDLLVADVGCGVSDVGCGVARGRLLRWSLLGAALVGVAMAKGPASAPVLGAAVAGSCVAARSARPLARPGIWLAMGAASVAVVPLLRPFWAARGTPGAVTEEVEKFLWDRERLGWIAVLIPSAFVAAFPASLGLLFAWHRSPRGADFDGTDRARIGRALAATWVLAMVIFTVAGIGNVRHAMAASVALPPLAALAWREWRLGIDRERDRRGIEVSAAETSMARAAFLGHAAAWPVILGIVAAVWVPLFESHRARQSGREAGIALAAAIPDRAEVWADALVESRPEVVEYALLAARKAGRSFTARWEKREIQCGVEPPPGTYLLLRSENEGSEGPRTYRAQIARGTIVPIATGRCYPDLAGTRYKVVFTLYRAADPGRNTADRPGG